MKRFIKLLPFILIVPFLSGCLDTDGDQVGALTNRVSELEAKLSKIRNERDHYSKAYKEYKARAITAEATVETLRKPSKSAIKNSSHLSAMKAQEEERELRRVQMLMSKQQVFLDAYIGTTFDKLITNSGKEYTAARVVSATPLDIGIMHQAGKTTLTYDQLPSEVAEKCGYSEETANIEMQRRAKDKEDQNFIQSNSSLPTNSLGLTNTEQEVKPKGVIETRITKTYRKNGKTFKDIEVTARSNVYARLRLGLNTTYTLSPNSTRTYNIKSEPGGSYKISLKTMNGEMLDAKSE